MYLMDDNPTVENIAKLIFDVAKEARAAGGGRSHVGDAPLLCPI